MIAVVPHAEMVSMTVRADRGHATLASTHREAERADALQYELGEGPCLDASEEVDWTRSGDLAHDDRWATWGPRAAAETTAASLLSVQLLGDDRPAGALNVYSRRTGQFGDRDIVDIALIYAAHAAVAVTAARQIDNLRVGMRSRHLIGLAQGRLTERFGVDEATSFALLSRLSQAHNVKVRDLAAQLVETGEIPLDESDA